VANDRNGDKSVARKASWPSPAWRDFALLVALTALAGFLSVHFELAEALTAWLRPAERYELDELPGVILCLALGLAWFAWRRLQESRRALVKRRVAEIELGIALEENRRMARESLRLQEDERRVLARELHDEFGQYLNAIKIDAVALRDDAGIENPASRHAASAIMEHVDHIHGTVRDMIGRLRPVGLDELGLAAALEHCVDLWRERLPNTEFSLSIDANLSKLPEDVSLTLYRLAQECLTNVSQHARARHADIELARRGEPQDVGKLWLVARDDGVGANLQMKVGGFGLLGMRERVEALGGELVLESFPGKGFCVTAKLPLALSTT